MLYKVTAIDLKLALLQYFRFKRQWICVDEFRGADIITDTGKEIIEVEVKVTKSDLINGERKKETKHLAYKHGGFFNRNRPNKFMFCVPEKLVDIAVDWTNQINECYGVIAFDVGRFLRGLDGDWFLWHCAFVRMAKSAKKLHENYDKELRWAIAKRASAKLTTLMVDNFEQIRRAANG